MKIIIFLVCLVIAAQYTQGQRFFYIESNRITDPAVRAGLLGAAQFITPAPIASDYIIRTNVVFMESSRIFSMNIVLLDSVSLKPIYETTEEQTYAVLNRHSGIQLKLSLQTFIEKNLSRMIICASQDHYDSRMKWLKPGKDKT